ncbi:N-acetylmuramoyl-L-alanine amidase [Shimia gijangensis]|uniref:N-acetylmuramoyl-L-alanine amidase n=1 Tax=Shimia gijangensis TaxID=1470563 RepID=A0A1M6N7R4_9RHOB|nr:N-acetylmuramoyl-L-alanine amidase [Shimia gijangensis]SHJ91770.1 N-acetylmuramoyl-L-alanine amidase [Shimia gijangensis]
MSRFFSTLMAIFLAGAALAQDFSGLARIDADKSHLSDARRGGVSLELALSQGVPWRIFQLDDPRRLVLDFREIDWGGFDAALLGDAKGVADLRFGQFRPGWSRMVLDLQDPLVVEKAGMQVSDVDGSGVLTVELRLAEPAAYAARSGAPFDPRWDLPEPALQASDGKVRPDWAPIVVVLDPGHGGIDPGAEREGAQEKELMLRFAREIRDTLRRTGGFEVILTRDEDVFVSLERRVSIAHAAGADVFISLHADSLQQGHATGATVYTLSEDASDAASAILAERHDRSDILAGIDLTGADDRVADVLLDLARMETQPRTNLLAKTLVTSMKEASGTLNKKPLRQAGFSVLTAADIPSVLIEVGFLSSKADLERLQDPNWRAVMAGGIRDGLLRWRDEDKLLRELVRQ